MQLHHCGPKHLVKLTILFRNGPKHTRDSIKNPEALNGTLFRETCKMTCAHTSSLEEAAA